MRDTTTTRELLLSQIGDEEHNGNKLVELCRPYVEDLLQIEVVDERGGPRWLQPWFCVTDAVALHAFIRKRQPTQYIEIGSGESTRFAHDAIVRAGLGTRIVSVDPEPRVHIDRLLMSPPGHHQRHRRTLDRSLGAELVEKMSPSDIVFLDGSHVATWDSDVSALVMEMIPHAPRGALFHIHDMFVPDRYPHRWMDATYSEQAVIEAMLIFDRGRTVKPLLSTYAAGRSEVWQRAVPELFGMRFGAADHTLGGSLWLERI